MANEIESKFSNLYFIRSFNCTAKIIFYCSFLVFLVSRVFVSATIVVTFASMSLAFKSDHRAINQWQNKTVACSSCLAIVNQ